MRALSQARTVKSQWSFWTCALLVAFSVHHFTIAELPSPRLSTLLPLCGRVGNTVEVTVRGTDLDHAEAILFTKDGIHAKPLLDSAGKRVPNRFVIHIAENVPTGGYDARVLGRFGVSNPRRFMVDPLPLHVSPSTNAAVSSSWGIPSNCKVSGTSDPGGMDWFHFDAKAGESYRLDCLGDRLDSRMQPSFKVLDATGYEQVRSRNGALIEWRPKQSGKYHIALHDRTFRGGEDYPYVLRISTAPLERFAPSGAPAPPDQSLVEEGNADNDTARTALAFGFPNVIAGVFHPANDRDYYKFDAKKGDTWWVEVISQRLGFPTDPVLVIERLIKKNGAPDRMEEVFVAPKLDSNPGGRELDLSSLDCGGRFEANQDGTYFVRVFDSFGRTDGSRANQYRLVVRKPEPDFQLFAIQQAPPSFQPDSREVLVLSPTVRAGSTLPVRVLALRREGFDGPIEITARNLPKGVTAQSVTLRKDQQSATLLISCNGQGTNWAGTVDIVGTAEIAKSRVDRVAISGSPIWPVADFNTELAQSRFHDRFVLAARLDLKSPITLIPAGTNVHEGTVGGKLSLPFAIQRETHYGANLKVRVLGVPEVVPRAQFELDPKVTNTVVEVDLNQQKIPPGDHVLYLMAQTSGKFSRMNAVELKQVEEEKVRFEKELAELAKLTGTPKAKESEARKKELEAAIKSSADRLKLQDVNVTVYSEPVRVKIVAPAKP